MKKIVNYKRFSDEVTNTELNNRIILNITISKSQVIITIKLEICHFQKPIPNQKQSFLTNEQILKNAE